MFVKHISISHYSPLLSLLPPFEPTLFPKLQVYFADFPYLRFAIQTPEASNLEDLLRLSVRNGMKLSLLHIIFHGTMHPHTYVCLLCASETDTLKLIMKKAFILLLLYAVGSDYLFPYHHHNYFPPFLQACKHIASLNKSNSAVFILLSSTYTNAHERQYCCCF